MTVGLSQECDAGDAHVRTLHQKIDPVEDKRVFAFSDRVVRLIESESINPKLTYTTGCYCTIRSYDHALLRHGVTTLATDVVHLSVFS